jgi:hypothetical protein
MVDYFDAKNFSNASSIKFFPAPSKHPPVGGAFIEFHLRFFIILRVISPTLDSNSLAVGMPPLLLALASSSWSLCSGVFISSGTTPFYSSRGKS